jgi:acyl-CoA hydrolase
LIADSHIRSDLAFRRGSTLDAFALQISIFLNSAKTWSADITPRIGSKKLRILYKFFRPHNKLDIGIIEATAITEDGYIVPGASVGATPEIIQMADKYIIEVNTALPSFEGIHDLVFTHLQPGNHEIVG